MLRVMKKEFCDLWFEISFVFEYIRNTLLIFWVDLWIRQNKFHYSNGSMCDVYHNSFFKKQLDCQAIESGEGRLVLNRYSVLDRKTYNRRVIAHNIDDEESPFKTFFLRQLAWYFYLKNHKLPKFVFGNRR